MPKTPTTLNEWPVMQCPACGKTFTTDDEDALIYRNPKLHCEHCEAELPILFVEHTITVTLGVKKESP